MNRFTFPSSAWFKYIATPPSSTPSMSSSRRIPIRSMLIEQATRRTPAALAERISYVGYALAYRICIRVSIFRPQCRRASAISSPMYPPPTIKILFGWHIEQLRQPRIGDSVVYGPPATLAGQQAVVAKQPQVLTRLMRRQLAQPGNLVHGELPLNEDIHNPQPNRMAQASGVFGENTVGSRGRVGRSTRFTLGCR